MQGFKNHRPLFVEFGQAVFFDRLPLSIWHGSQLTHGDFSMVFAFAGDSTISKFLAMYEIRFYGFTSIIRIKCIAILGETVKS
jgi:hypothetical protein